MNRPYYALTGPELIEAIVADFRAQAQASGLFPLNKTFPQVSYKFDCEVELYPAEPPQFHVLTQEEMLREYEADPNCMGKPIRGKVSGGRSKIGKEVAPDQVRDETGQQKHKPVLKPGVGVVDELVDAIQPGQGRRGDGDV